MGFGFVLLDCYSSRKSVPEVSQMLQTACRQGEIEGCAERKPERNANSIESVELSPID